MLLGIIKTKVPSKNFKSKVFYQNKSFNISRFTSNEKCNRLNYLWKTTHREDICPYYFDFIRKERDPIHEKFIDSVSSFDVKEISKVTFLNQIDRLMNIIIKKTNEGYFSHREIVLNDEIEDIRSTFEPHGFIIETKELCSSPSESIITIKWKIIP